MTDHRPEIRRQGLGVSAGIAFGRAYLIGRDTLKAPRHHIEPDDRGNLVRARDDRGVRRLATGIRDQSRDRRLVKLRGIRRR